MAVKINISPAKIEAKIQANVDRNMALLSSEILGDCNKYAKEDTGMLIASSYVHSELDKGKLIWQTPYARRQYWEIQTANKYPNPNASWKWCEVAKVRHKSQWERQAQVLMGGKG